MSGAVTADTGFLIGLERAKPRATALLAAARRRSLRVSVPAAVVAEWWRGGRAQAQLLKLVEVEPLTERLAKSAGKALAAVSSATVVDAIVIASAGCLRAYSRAARRGSVLSARTVKREGPGDVAASGKRPVEALHL